MTAAAIFTCTDCSRQVWSLGAPDDRHLCAICRFIATQPEAIRPALRHRLLANDLTDQRKPRP